MGRRRSGFTLIEIVMVVAIIGLLAAIAMPAYNTVRSKSLRVAQMANVRIVNSAVEQWAMDNMVPDGEPIGAGVVNYIRGGLAGLGVGGQAVDATNLTAQVVGHVFTVSDLY